MTPTKAGDSRAAGTLRINNHRANNMITETKYHG